MELMKELTAYFDRLVEAQKAGHNVNREMTEAIVEMRQAIGIGEPPSALYYSIIEGMTGEKARRYINYQIIDAVKNVDWLKEISIHYRRCDGATTSAIAAAKAFPNVYVAMSTYFALGVKHERVISLEEAQRKTFQRKSVLIIDDMHEIKREFPDFVKVIRLVGHEDVKSIV